MQNERREGHSNVTIKTKLPTNLPKLNKTVTTDNMEMSEFSANKTKKQVKKAIKHNLVEKLKSLNITDNLPTTNRPKNLILQEFNETQKSNFNTNPDPMNHTTTTLNNASDTQTQESITQSAKLKQKHPASRKNLLNKTENVSKELDNNYNGQNLNQKKDVKNQTDGLRQNKFKDVELISDVEKAKEGQKNASLTSKHSKKLSKYLDNVNVYRW